MRKISSGSLLSTHTFCSIQRSVSRQGRPEDKFLPGMAQKINIDMDVRGIKTYIFLISPRKHRMCVHMRRASVSTCNIRFCREININIFRLKKRQQTKTFVYRVMNKQKIKWNKKQIIQKQEK